MAHLRPDSFGVEAGERVSFGDVIGLIGNSGNATEPHLHIHVVEPATGRGVPITFDGHFPARNSLVRR